MYQFSADSLRYYENIGLIQPLRSESGYRLYGLDEIWKLNVIKDMRKMNFTFNRIKDFFCRRTIHLTKDYLMEQIGAINQSIAQLEQLRGDIYKRLENIDHYSGLEVDSHISARSFPERRCMSISSLVIKPEEIDLGFRRLQLKSNEMINLMGNKDLCVFMSIEKIENKVPDFYQSVFCIVEEADAAFDFVLPAGEYLCVKYRGPHVQSMEHTQALLDFAREKHYLILDLPIEVCLIDVHDTGNQAEYVTEIQLRVKR